MGKAGSSRDTTGYVELDGKRSGGVYTPHW